MVVVSLSCKSRWNVKVVKKNGRSVGDSVWISDSSSVVIYVLQDVPECLVIIIVIIIFIIIFILILVLMMMMIIVLRSSSWRIPSVICSLASWLVSRGCLWILIFDLWFEDDDVLSFKKSCVRVTIIDFFYVRGLRGLFVKSVMQWKKLVRSVSEQSAAESSISWFMNREMSSIGCRSNSCDATKVGSRQLQLVLQHLRRSQHHELL